jgi:choline dehydrogenase
MEEFDYIVVGGGSAGCVAAGELAKDGAFRVLLLEAGPRAEDHPESLDADGYKDAFINDAIIWERFSTRQAHSARQHIFMGSGTVMGGSGSVNGMVYTRGSREDWNEWPTGWKWDDVIPDFESLEKMIRPNRRPATKWTEACIESAELNGFRRKEDLNDGDMSGVIGYEWMNYEGDRRRSSYVSFIKDAPLRSNLVIETGALVNRLVFDDDRRTSAVEYEVDGEKRSAASNCEVILCAGALETPKLLMLSGVGPAAHLRELGIPIVLDVPGVGANLHDHPNVPVFCRTPNLVDAKYPQLYSFFRTHEGTDLPQGQADTCYVYWPAPSSMKQMAKRVLPAKVLPQWLYGPRGKHIVRAFVEFAFRLPPVQRFVQGLFGIIIILGKPKSRGRLRLRSTDPKAPALIDPSYYEHPEDMETMVRGVRKARQILASGGLAAWGAKELLPGARVKKDRAIVRYVTKNTLTTYHYAGTCSMGEKADSVVDLQLRVRGVSGLRVGDASVISTVPVSALNAPSMLIGFRAAKYILEDTQG